MKAKFDKVTLKLWFSNQSTSRNIHNVTELEHDGNIGIVRTIDNRFFINMANINLIEELERRDERG